MTEETSSWKSGKKRGRGWLVGILVLLVLLAARHFDLDRWMDSLRYSQPGSSKPLPRRLVNAPGLPGQTVRTKEGVLIVEYIDKQVRFKRGDKLVEPELGERVDQDLGIYLGHASVIGLKGLEGESIYISGSFSPAMKDMSKMSRGTAWTICTLDLDEGRYGGGNKEAARGQAPRDFKGKNRGWRKPPQTLRNLCQPLNSIGKVDND